MDDVVAVTEAWLNCTKTCTRRSPHSSRQPGRIDALFACCTCLEGTIAEHEQWFTELRDALNTLQTQGTKTRASLAVRGDTGASVAGRVQKLRRKFLFAKKDLRPMQMKRRTPMAKEQQLLGIHEGLEGQVAVLSARLCGAQAEQAG